MVASNPEMSRQMSDAGEKRSRDFSWSKHVEELVGLLRSLTDKN
jgi:glycosyltransferase involved in cell wall biosynthesis